MKQIQNGGGTNPVNGQRSYISVGRNGNDVMIRADGKVFAFDNFRQLVNSIDPEKAPYICADFDTKQKSSSDKQKCSFGDGITIKPDGVTELDPCIYVETEAYENVTVHVLRCLKCGHTEVEWERQPDTIDITGETP